MTDAGTDDRVPPGWDRNPSAWSQRVPVVVLAAAGFVVATYLALFQVGAVDTVWDPLFGDGTRTILTSKLSHVLPVPDAALGAVGYLVDVGTAVHGGRERWRTKPWAVLAFGLTVGPMAAGSVVLAVLQPVVFDAWCTLCLLSAAISLTIVGPATDEVLASLQYLRWVHDRDGSVTGAFWKGTRNDSLPHTAGEWEA